MVILGTSQDGGVPQAGCSCNRCHNALENPQLRIHPTSCAIIGSDGSISLLEATRNLAEQLGIVSSAMGKGGSLIPDSICVTHFHLGHVDGLGQFGKEAMGVDSIPFFSSSKAMDVLENRGLSSPFEKNVVPPFLSFEPINGCGFELTLIPVPHRDEFSDTHAVLINGPRLRVLFLPDHDNWAETLLLHESDTIRDWLAIMEVDIALLDGTFWDLTEIPNRRISEVPHPTISETIELLGERKDGDPEIYFIHMNHSNPVLDKESEQSRMVRSKGWSVAEQCSVFLI